MTVKHTPTPWHLAETKTSLYFVDVPFELGEIEEGQEHPAHDTTICDFEVDEHDGIDAEANAEFALRAINNHDGLLAALSVAEAIITKAEVRRHWNEHYNTTTAQSFDAINRKPPQYLADIRAAIAKAKAPHIDQCEFCRQLEKLRDADASH